jgi:glycosyltransferase involved in cell wall biosynthesis
MVFRAEVMPGMETDSVSVVIPTHDRRDLLAVTLRSVLRQKNVQLDVIVVDDGSTDDTLEFLRTIDDPRVRFIRNESPQGVRTARNQGIAATSGEWLAFVDDDDVWAPEKLARQLQAAHESGRPWVYAGAIEIDEEGRALSGSPPQPPKVVASRLPHFDLVPGGSSGVLASRVVVQEAGGWDPSVFLADWDLWIRLGRIGPPAWVAEPLVGYRIHGGQSSVDVDRVLAGARAISAKYGAALDRGPFHHYVAFLCLRSNQRSRALAHFGLAAFFGEAIPVVKDLSGILRRRLGRRLKMLDHRSDPQTAWKMKAETWLSELRHRSPPPVEYG